MRKPNQATVLDRSEFAEWAKEYQLPELDDVISDIAQNLVDDFETLLERFNERLSERLHDRIVAATVTADTKRLLDELYCSPDWNRPGTFIACIGDPELCSITPHDVHATCTLDELVEGLEDTARSSRPDDKRGRQALLRLKQWRDALANAADRLSAMLERE